MACLKDIQACDRSVAKVAQQLKGVWAMDAHLETMVVNNGTHRIDLAARYAFVRNATLNVLRTSVRACFP